MIRTSPGVFIMAEHLVVTHVYGSFLVNPVIQYNQVYNRTNTTNI